MSSSKKHSHVDAHIIEILLLSRYVNYFFIFYSVGVYALSKLNNLAILDEIDVINVTFSCHD